jgi:hypothetical protein
MSPPSSGSKNKLAELCFSPDFTFVSGLNCTCTLKMGAIYSSETSVDYQRATWHYIQKIEIFT